MKKRMTVALILCLVSPWARADDQALKGVWFRGDGLAKVEIDNCGASVCATNLWIKPGTKGEKAGDRLVMDLKPEGAGRFEGQAHDPQRGLTYNIEIAAGPSTMTTRGCVLARLLCKSVNWTRAR